MIRTVIIQTTSACLLALLSSACATSPETETSTDQAASSAVVTDEGSQVICRRYDSTGSRVRRERVCMTANEWDALNAGAKDYTRALQDGGATQPGGQSLQNGN